jgi:serine/threonine protein kinase
MDAFEPGTDLGKYRVVRRLASGGMADVYLTQARGPRGSSRFVVLKHILPPFATSETFVKLFVNEALVTATLDHPNIARIHDIGTAGGDYFFTMEYLHGEDLGRMLERLEARGLRLPLEQALTIGAGVAAGLHAAHEKRDGDGRPLGILHGDVSPSSVVITYDGGVKLVDFGLARLTTQAEIQLPGGLERKPAHASPEQRDDLPADRRSDVFALGALLYELTTQTRLSRTYPASGNTRLALDEEIPHPSSLVGNYPSELEPTIIKSLARERNQRHGSAREVQLALEQVARTRGLTVSSARLGEWMIATFGTRPAPWISVAPEEKGRPVQVALPAPESGGESRGDPREAPGEAPTPEPPAPVAADPGPVLAPLPMGNATGNLTGNTTAGMRLSPWWRPRSAFAAGLGLFALTATALLGGALRSPSADRRPDLAGERAGAPGTPDPGTVGAGPRDESIRGTLARPFGRLAPSRSFSAILASKQSEIMPCFTRFSPPGKSAAKIEVRFRVDVDGRVTRTEVLPPEVAQTGLGICVADAVFDIQFDPQTTPLVVRIPVSVRRAEASSRPAPGR